MSYYVPRIKVNLEAQPVAVALIEAKAQNLPPGHGLEQVKTYGSAKRMNVPFVFSSNGHLFVEYEYLTDRARALKAVELLVERKLFEKLGERRWAKLYVCRPVLEAIEAK